MKKRILLFISALVLIAGCSGESTSTGDTQGKALNSVNKSYLGPGASIQDGYYLIKNRWTGEYLNWSHKIVASSSVQGCTFYCLERGSGPIDLSYVWHFQNLPHWDLGYGRLSPATDDTFLVQIAQNYADVDNAYTSSVGLSRYSSDPAIQNSTDPTGPFMIGYDSGIGWAALNTQQQLTKNGIGIVYSSPIPDPGWQSKDWYFIPTSKDGMMYMIDNFFTKTSDSLGASRYIYQCAGSVAVPSDPSQLQYNTANWGGGVGWWDAPNVYSNGYCGFLSYTNVKGGIAGFGLNLAKSGTAQDISAAKGITFWAASDYGIDPLDPNNEIFLGPIAQVQINSANITSNGWLGNYWHCKFPLTYNWHQFTISFSDAAAWKKPVYDSGIALKDCLKQAISIEFQQSVDDNAAGRQDVGNIYIDDVELYY